ncbi:hypothetical protein F4821DRAFT_269662 [Hypoxylon rubiginosum]|uniref:Uncharacterized protein n=1 Tax=Hypoxylon rubiginosum TaxID=110542 RepID=A0ACC0D319_9PEZI|nr:hypothetical protein F4821DRAFT_269662 [Hypoxylon rubiginosum]
MVSLFAGRILNASRITAAIPCLIFITTVSLQLAAASAAQTLPYIPTTIFIPESKPAPAQENAITNIAYIFSPQDDWVDLLALNFSGKLRASSLPFQTLSSNVPFLDTNSTAFTPSLADNGSLIVWAGDCSSSANSEIWTFDPSPDDGASSSWTRASATLATGTDSVELGPGFLGSSFSFSTTLEPELSPAKTYAYGGMCPGTASNTTTWQSNATYSNQMIKIEPPEADAAPFTISTVSIKGHPVSEAGFTFTSLPPSISNHSGVVTQQVNYVLLGGHTEYAFINMSTVAIWSLPEESWSFISDISIASSSTANTELAIKSAVTSIDSRSGHTAVLSQDGTSLIILGGWVGDTTQAASPQLAVLKVGDDYGGVGNWEWIVPDEQPTGSGIYGHGAALLPGNVMMVYGGYSISSTSTKARREPSEGNTMFLNLTSMSWSDDYENPEYTGVSHDNSSTTPSDSIKQRLGLGLGLGLGILAIIAAVGLFFLYRRRLRHKRTIRDSAIRALAQDNAHFLPHDDEMMERDHLGGGWYTGGADPYMRGNSRSLGYQSLQTGRGSLDNGQQPWLGGLAPAQVARKPLPRRNTYDPPTTSRGPSVIHPIIEADEDGHDGDITREPVSPLRDNNVDGRRDSDPFLTPTHEHQISFPPPSRASATPSPEDRRRSATDPEVQDWMSDVEAMSALISRGAARSGQTSPTKRGPSRSGRLSAAAADDDGRTDSNVSESNRNNLAVNRSSSIRSFLPRSGFGVAALALSAAADEGRGGSSSSSSAPSYNTARSSFPALQAEGPALLMGKTRGDDDDDYDDLGSPSKRKPRRSWFGSLKRVFSGATPSPPESTGKNSPENDDDDGYGEASDYETRLGGLSGIAAGGLLRRKSGRGAWEALEQGEGKYKEKGKGKNRALPSGAATAGPSGEMYAAAEDDEDDDEWDIEKAVEKRLVQVMFTVPKERLRVVNAEPDIESGKDVVVVDPEKEELEREKEEIRESEKEKEHAGRDFGAPLPSPSPVSVSESEKEKDIESGDAEAAALREVREELDAEWRGRQPSTPVRDSPPQHESSRLLDVERSGESRKRKPSRSPVEDLESEVYSAQAITLERPRTRVLAMVESIESLSREASPAGSPTR